MAGTSSQSGSSHSWELSLYELHRKPHEMVSDTTNIAISPRALRNELMCPICLDLMRNAQTTKECLHRFCQECIITALRSGNKECPTCRKKLVSKRSLRPDPNFDALIAKIYPNREELNAMQEKQQTRRSHPLPRRKRKATETPPTESPDAKRPKNEDSTCTSRTNTPPPGEQISQDNEQVELQIRPHPHDLSLVDEMIRTLVTTKDCTVAHLVKYLSISAYLDSEETNCKKSAVRKLTFTEEDTVPGEKKYSLYIQMGTSDEYVCLPSGSSLKQITDTYWTGDKLKLYVSTDESQSTTL